jgi:transposase-like protein
MARHLRPLASSDVKTAERIEARRLRRDEGRSIKDIARRVGVSQSSVSIWVRDIQLTPEQHGRLQEANGLHFRQILAHAALAERHRQRRTAAQMEGRRHARAADPFHAAGCMHVYSKYSQKKRTNRLPYGTCRVSVSRTAIVQHIFGAIQEYAGFERPEWLDALRSEVPPVRS